MPSVIWANMEKKIYVVLLILLMTMSYGCAATLNETALKGSESEVKNLLDQGADVNSKDSGGFSPLTNAALSGQGSIVKLLIDKGADVDYALEKLKRCRPHCSRGLQLLESIAKKQNLIQSWSVEGVSSVNKTHVPTDGGTEVSLVIQSDVDALPAKKWHVNKNAYAVIIGIEQYRQKLPKADFATHDAQTLTAYLTKVLGYPAENVVTLTNDHAALGDFVKYFEKWLPNNVEQGSTVFVYYAGHGAPNPKTSDAYLVPYDGDPAFIDETGYSLKRMYSALGKLPAKEIIIALDSCFSGAGGRSVIAKGSRPLVMNLQNSTVLSKNMTVMSASSGEQVSSTYDEKGHGLFTYFILKGIKNENVIRPDGSIKVDDLFSYIKSQVEHIARKQYNSEQTPQLIESKKN